MIEWVVLILLVLVTVLAVALMCDYPDSGTFTIWIVLVCIPWSMWHWRETPQESAVRLAREAAERKARETPHVIREADGCKVYAFHKGDREHFFTRCPAATDTETTWSESCGKNCRKEMSDHIVQENGK